MVRPLKHGEKRGFEGKEEKIEKTQKTFAKGIDKR